jgi:arginyl-tRNA synthetase
MVVFGNIPEDELRRCDKQSLTDASELSLLKALSFWPERVKSAACTIEPHRVPICLQEIANALHSLWNAGKQNAELRFVSADDRPITIARLSLLMATKIVLGDGLKLMGITPMSEMR